MLKKMISSWVFVLFSTLFFVNICAAETRPKVLVLPVTIHSEKDLSYLKNGIMDIFFSRIGNDGRVDLISRKEAVSAYEKEGENVDIKASIELGRNLSADYVVSGSITIFGENADINIQLLDVSNPGRPSLSLNQSVESKNVIPQISLFADKINKELFENTDGKKTSLSSQKTQGEEPFSPEYQKVRDFNMSVNSLSIEDVDKDGKNETILLDVDTVRICRFEGSRFLEIQNITPDNSRRLLSVDCADINGNGYPEIFVTALNIHRTSVRSFVIEFNGKEYVTIVEKSNWFYRVVEFPDRGKALYGQQYKHVGSNPFSGKIFKMTWESSRYVPLKPEIPLKNENILGCTFGDISNKGKIHMAAFASNDYVRIKDMQGDEIWKSDERFGGGSLYMVMAEEGMGEQEKRRFFPMRLLVADTDGNGKNELIVVKNHELLGGMRENYRNYLSAHIQSMGWTGSSFSVHWKAGKYSGQITDVAFGDFDNDRKKELVASLLIKKGSIIGKGPKSRVITFK